MIIDDIFLLFDQTIGCWCSLKPTLGAVATSTQNLYEGESISNQPIPFPIDRDGHDFHALFQYMFYTWEQNCMPIKSFFNKILNVKHG